MMTMKGAVSARATAASAAPATASRPLATRAPGARTPASEFRAIQHVVRPMKLQALGLTDAMRNIPSGTTPTASAYVAARR